MYMEGIIRQFILNMLYDIPISVFLWESEYMYVSLEAGEWSRTLIKRFSP